MCRGRGECPRKRMNQTVYRSSTFSRKLNAKLNRSTMFHTLSVLPVSLRLTMSVCALHVCVCMGVSIQCSIPNSVWARVGICRFSKMVMLVIVLTVAHYSMRLSVSLRQWKAVRISGKHSPVQQKTDLHSCGPRWTHSWLLLWTQSGPTRTACVPQRNHFPATQKATGMLNP